MNKKATYLEMVGIAALTVFIDQITKYLVRMNLALRETWMPLTWLEPYFRVVHWKNTGVAFGMFQGNGWIFTVVGLAVIVLIIFFYGRVTNESVICRVALAMELGGALGNLIDRVNPRLGYVVDFLWFGNFPVFNLADTAIVIGAFLLIYYMWKEESRQKKETAAVSESGGEEVHE